MSANLPDAFVASFDGPQGPYTLAFDPQKDARCARITSGEETSFWMIDRCEPAPRGWELGGLTGPAWAQWDDVYWASIFVGSEVERIEFWGNQVLVRTDLAHHPASFAPQDGPTDA